MTCDSCEAIYIEERENAVTVPTTVLLCPKHAATDELIEACKKTAHTIRHGEGREVDYNFGQALAYCLTIVEAAIAKAGAK